MDLQHEHTSTVYCKGVVQVLDPNHMLLFYTAPRLPSCFVLLTSLILRHQVFHLTPALYPEPKASHHHSVVSQPLHTF